MKTEYTGIYLKSSLGSSTVQATAPGRIKLSPLDNRQLITTEKIQNLEKRKQSWPKKKTTGRDQKSLPGCVPQIVDMLIPCQPI